MNATCPCERYADAYELYKTDGIFTIDGTDIELTNNEWRLMRLLATTPGAYYTETEIVEKALRMPGETTRRVKDIVRRLRAKMTTAGYPELLQNSRGCGYRINLSKSQQAFISA